MQHVDHFAIGFFELHGNVVIVVSFAKRGDFQPVIGTFQGETNHRGGHTEQSSFLAVDDHLHRRYPLDKIISYILHVGNSYQDISDFFSDFT